MWPHSLKVAQLLRSAACLHIKSVPVIFEPPCTLQDASAAVGNAIPHIPTVLQGTLMHLLKQAIIFTGTTLRLDIYLLLRLVKTSNKSE